MMLFFIVLLIAFTFNIQAQICDASFFPSVKSINPGTAHMRTTGFVALDLSQKKVEKVHDVPLGGIVGGIRTNVELKKATIFRAGRGPGITFEALFDQENGDKEEKINSTTFGERTITNQAKSTYYGGILDLKYFGISYAGANYSIFDKFRVGDAPNISARDIDTTLSYSNIKIGSAIKIGVLRFGAFVLDQRSKGDYQYTFYDPTTGNKGSTENFPATTSAKGYGVGIGFTTTRFRLETSLEKMYANKLNISEDYPQETKTPPPSSRLSATGEVRFKAFAFGLRVRSNKGNYTDLEDIISSNLLYGNMEADDTRLETSFNFSFGDQKGITYSAFYTQSKSTADEKSPVFNNDLKYEANTESKAFGINLSYIY